MGKASRVKGKKTHNAQFICENHEPSVKGPLRIGSCPEVDEYARKDWDYHNKTAHNFPGHGVPEEE